jgi:hypothetical protein
MTAIARRHDEQSPSYHSVARVGKSHCPTAPRSQAQLTKAT